MGTEKSVKFLYPYSEIGNGDCTAVVYRYITTAPHECEAAAIGEGSILKYSTDYSSLAR